MKTFKARKWEDILQFSAVLLAVYWLNLLAGDYFFRWDLTEEKRYTLAEPTQQLLSNLSDEVFVEVYLGGELNAQFKEFRKSIRETLQEFKIYAGKNLDYAFINPDEAESERARQLFYRQLQEKGIQPTTLYDEVDGKKMQKLIFPGAYISYKGKSTPVQLFKGQRSATVAQQLAQATEGVEYEIAMAIRKLSIRQKKQLAFVKGHQELEDRDLAEATAALSEFYIVDRVDLKQTQLDRYAALIIAQPKSAFDEEDLYLLDQYIMNGGRAMFFFDQVQMNLDSIAAGGTYAFGYDLNLEDLLFKYGVRVNTDLVQDQQMRVQPMVVGQLGNRPNIQPIPWPYDINLNNYGEHLIVKNLDVIASSFVSSVDTIKSSPVRKIPLVYSSQRSRIKGVPTMVSLDEAKKDLDPSLYNRRRIPVAYLLEGRFRSFFDVRFPPSGYRDKPKLSESKPTKMLIFGDGDVIRNRFSPRSGQPIPLDFDPQARMPLSNKDFLLNAVAYLIDEDGLIASKGKEFTMRPLDVGRIQAERRFWQFVNVGLPVLLVVFFGLGWTVLRKRKYEKRITHHA